VPRADAREWDKFGGRLSGGGMGGRLRLLRFIRGVALAWWLRIFLGG
jgi:hypothetical protein